MPNGIGHKEYGKHKYHEATGTGDCLHGCGCRMEFSDSGGPLGLDPFGTCPKNPKDGRLLGGNLDHQQVVKQRIEDLERRAYEAEAALAKVRPSKKNLAEELELTREQLDQARQLLRDFKQQLASCPLID